MFDERRFRAELVMRGLKLKDVATMLNIDEATLYRKLRNGGSFSREEIGVMIEKLKLKDPMQIFFAEELAETQVL